MRWLPRIIPLTLALAAGACTLFWLQTGTASVSLRLPGADRPPGMALAQAIDLTGVVTPGPGQPPGPHPQPFAEWPGFRNTGTGRSPETGLLKNPAQAPILWQIDLGEGYAAPALRNGRLYILDYTAGTDALRCLNPNNGE